MDVRTILQAGALLLCGLSGYAAYKVAHRGERIAGATSITAAAAEATVGLQDWAALKTILGLGVPSDKGPEGTARFSQAYDPIEWKGWQALRARFADAQNVWVTVTEAPRVSAALDDAGLHDVELPVRVAGRFGNEVRTEQARVRMTVVPGSGAERRSFRLTGMTVEP